MDASIIISIISLLVSATVATITHLRWKEEKDREKREQAPLIVISSIKYVSRNKYLTFPEKFYSDPNSSEFILSKRAAFDTEKNTLLAPEFSLLIDARAKGSQHPKTSYVNLNRITLENVGADMLRFEIDKIEIKLGGETLSISPSELNYLHHRFTSLKPVEVLISYFQDMGTQLFDEQIRKNEDHLNAIDRYTKSELLGVTLSPPLENFDYMVFYLTTYNLFQNPYKQRITIYSSRMPGGYQAISERIT